MQHVSQWDCDHSAAQRSEQRAQLADALAVGPPAASRIHRVADLQHIAPVKNSGLFDASRTQAQRPDGLCDAGDLRPAGRRARAGQHRQVLADHHGVLDEDRVRAVISGGCLLDHPAAGSQRVGIGLVLRAGQSHIHRRAADVRDDPLGQPAAGPADQAGAVHRIAPHLTGVSDAHSKQPGSMRRRCRISSCHLPIRGEDHGLLLPAIARAATQGGQPPHTSLRRGREPGIQQQHRAVCRARVALAA